MSATSQLGPEGLRYVGFATIIRCDFEDLHYLTSSLFYSQVKFRGLNKVANRGGNLRKI